MIARLWSSERLRGWCLQGLLIAAVATVVGYFAVNTVGNLERRSIPFGLGFLSRPAGFDFPFHVLDWKVTDTYGRAVVVALANTVLVSVLAIATTTVLGLVLGIMRLSLNWLVRTTATLIVEFIKNTPQLIQIFFFYIAVLQALPQARESFQAAGMFLNIRGLFLPAPVMGDAAGLDALALLVAVALGSVLWRGRARVTGTARRALAAVAWLLPLGALVHAWATGMIAAWEWPELRGFNFRGGWVVRPELLALWIGLSVYTGVFIAEIVRSAINAIDRGQTEAARSLGLTRGQNMRLVILPQALRLIIPPLTSQYLNVIKSSSLGAAIAYPEVFLMIGGTTLNQTGQAIEAMAIVMSVFLSVNLVTSAGMNWYNRAVALKER
ncbi:MAG: ABC transporter permease subunit [Alphaproteobacteria bacterium]|nr:ABC transporter permease subunit [Alphaproteobacteria bacterium]